MSIEKKTIAFIVFCWDPYLKYMLVELTKSVSSYEMVLKILYPMINFVSRYKTRDSLAYTLRKEAPSL